MDLSDLRALVHGRRVLVTGAGGSIGSEICKQVMSLGPSKLLLLDHSEFNLYQADQALRISSIDASVVVPLLIDIKDYDSLHRVVAEQLPEIVFHAAAYKHVHLVEMNACSSILNNVLGTWNLLRACEAVQAKTFVQISTDKAVNPGGIMGATKRVCELLVTEVGHRTGWRYCSVRFGNVLGSSGSLIPLLSKQIQNNEPVTITHPEMTRYFMLIPEAVSLVLRAATIGKPGEIAILKMGDPVRIVDIARSLIALMGKTKEEVPIVFTGIRPGEKMFEELYMCGNEIKTSDPDVLILPEGDGSHLDSQVLSQRIQRMLELCRYGSRDGILELNEIIRPHLRVAPDLVIEAEAQAKSELH